MKTCVILFLASVSLSTCYGQNYFDGSITFKIIDNGNPISNDEFMRNWKISDERDCVNIFNDDTISRKGDYFELSKDKRNFMRYSDSLKTFSLKLGASAPYFSFQLVNGLDTVCYFSGDMGDVYCDSVDANQVLYYFSPGQYFEGSEKHPGKSVLLSVAGWNFDVDLLKSEGVFEERDE